MPDKAPIEYLEVQDLHLYKPAPGAALATYNGVNHMVGPHVTPSGAIASGITSMNSTFPVMVTTTKDGKANAYMPLPSRMSAGIEEHRRHLAFEVSPGGIKAFVPRELSEQHRETLLGPGTVVDHLSAMHADLLAAAPANPAPPSGMLPRAMLEEEGDGGMEEDGGVEAVALGLRDLRTAPRPKPSGFVPGGVPVC